MYLDNCIGAFVMRCILFCYSLPLPGSIIHYDYFQQTKAMLSLQVDTSQCR